LLRRKQSALNPSLYSPPAQCACIFGSRRSAAFIDGL